MSEWNPRYLAYARANGRHPTMQQRHDHIMFPGGANAGFICWIANRWAEYRAERKLSLNAILSDADHKAFDKMIGAA